MEIYISTDVETDGPLPGVNSMLAFASAAFTANKTLLSTFSVNLQPLVGAKVDAKTMQWWENQTEAWALIRQDPQEPKIALENYLNWLRGLKAKLVFVGYPAAFDFMFIYWYLHHFTGECPFSFSALDIKTYAMALLKRSYKDTVKNTMPREWFDPKHPHTHVPLDDAIEQGLLFCNMLAQNK